MSGFNKVILMGHLTRDPQLDALPNGTAVCQLGLAVNRRWKDAQGQQREEVLFVDCSAFDKRAEALAKYFKKGSPIHVDGHLKLEQWEAQDGTARSKIRVIVERFSFVDGGEAGNATKSNGNPSPAPRSGKRRTTVPAEPMLAAAAASSEEIPF